MVHMFVHVLPDPGNGTSPPIDYTYQHRAKTSQNTGQINTIFAALICAYFTDT